jgi:UDP-2,3-diacylglucosamine pyrophosphatase LpxH
MGSSFSFSKTNFRTLWLSDIHLGNKDCHAEYLLSFLQKISCDRLYLVGDIVDMLALKNRVYWPKAHAEVLKFIYQLANTDTEVIYIPGNHDMPMRYYDQGLLLNVQLHQQYIHTTRKGKKLLVVHGDEFDHAVLYRTMNRMIGSSAYDLMTFLNRTVHKLRSLVGLQYWSFANYLKENIGQARRAIEDFEKAAVAEARQRHLDGVVCGHIHKPQLRHIGEILYCNDGDWTESCSAVVENHCGELELLDWDKIQNLIMVDEKQVLEAA